MNPIQELSGGSPVATLLTGLGIDEVISRTESGSTATFLTDALGSTVALTDGTGAVQTEYTYEPFGAVTVTGTSSTNSYHFTGRENDNTGLFYYRARYYAPLLQRFISEDPIEFVGGDPNLYAYVFNSPTNFTDPTGEIAPLIGFCVRGAFNGIANDLLSGRKVSVGNAAFGCATGGLSKALRFAQQKKGGRRGEGHEGHSRGESKQVDQAAKEAGLGERGREALKNHIDEFKQGTGRGGDDNLTYKQLLELARQIGQLFGGQ